MSTWLRAEDCRLDEFRTLVGQRTRPGDYPHAEGVEQNALVYDSERLRAAQERTEVQTELVRALLDGPGIVVLKRAFAHLAVVDRATEVFNELIEQGSSLRRRLSLPHRPGPGSAGRRTGPAVAGGHHVAGGL